MISSYSRDRSDSSDSSDSSDQTTLYTKKLNLSKAYLPTYLCDSNYCRDDSSDSSDNSGSSDSNDSSDINDHITLYTKKFYMSEWVRKITQLLHTKKLQNLQINHATSPHKNHATTTKNQATSPEKKIRHPCEWVRKLQNLSKKNHAISQQKYQSTSPQKIANLFFLSGNFSTSKN